jgi:hypothetical protein
MCTRDAQRGGSRPEASKACAAGGPPCVAVHALSRPVSSGPRSTPAARAA